MEVQESIVAWENLHTAESTGLNLIDFLHGKLRGITDKPAYSSSCLSALFLDATNCSLSDRYKVSTLLIVTKLVARFGYHSTFSVQPTAIAWLLKVASSNNILRGDEEDIKVCINACILLLLILDFVVLDNVQPANDVLARCSYKRQCLTNILKIVKGLDFIDNKSDMVECAKLTFKSLSVMSLDLMAFEDVEIIFSSLLHCLQHWRHFDDHYIVFFVKLLSKVTDALV